MYAKNYQLGKQIHALLLAQGLENPMLNEVISQWPTASHQLVLQQKMAEFLQLLGLDLTDASLAKTPNRVIKFFTQELFAGLNYHNFPEISLTSNNFNYTNPLISTGISVNSTCEHHLVAISGEAIVGYMPKHGIIGLSKLNRIVDFFARRPQVQERMTRQIFVTLQHLLATDDVAIAINATHNCIVTRGVNDLNTKTLTLELGGKFLTEHSLKDNFYQLALTMDKTKG